MLKDDILLGIFNYYRLDEYFWNIRLGWRKLSHICRRWRQLIFSSAFHLGMHIWCTNDSLTVDTLDHLPPLPLFIDFKERIKDLFELWEESLVVRNEDESGIYHALRLRDRVRRINLSVSPSTLDEYFRVMDKPFPILEHLSLSLTGYAMLALPSGFLAPNLCHLDLDIRLPKRLRLLTSTPSLVTLKLTNIRASGYFRPRLLVARLESLPQLEDLSIGFSIPIPRPSSERLLLGKQGIPVMLSNLKSLTFRGVSVYLERLISQIRAPVLRELDITLFNQLAFTLPHLSHFVNITEKIKFTHTAAIDFHPGSFITLTHYGGFKLCVKCRSSDWQMDCAAQICSALMSALSGVETLNIGGQIYSLLGSDSETDEVDDTIGSRTWHELLRLFVSVKELDIGPDLTVVLSRVLEVDEIGLDPGLLPDLREIVSGRPWNVDPNSLFGSFIHARQIAGRPISLHMRPPQQFFSLPFFSSPK